MSGSGAISERLSHWISADARARLLAALTLGWTLTWVGRAALSPVGPAVQQELGLGLEALGLLPTLGVLGAAGGYLAAGRWAARDARACLLAGIGLVGLAGLAASAAPGFAALAATQVLAGVGEGLFFVPALALVAASFPAQGRALGTLDTGISLGSALVLLAAAALLPLAGWRGVFALAGVLALGALALLARAVPATPPAAATGWAEVRQRRAWPLYAAIMLLLAVYFALLYLSPAFLLSRGFALADADLLTAAAVALGVPWHVAGGVFADRHGAARVAVAFTLLFALALTAMALPLHPWFAVGALVLGYSLGIAGFVALITLVPRVLGAHLAAPAYGVFWGLGYLGGSAGPFAAAAIAGAAGFGTAMLGLALLAAGAAVALLPLLVAEHRRTGPLQTLDR